MKNRTVVKKIRKRNLINCRNTFWRKFIHFGLVDRRVGSGRRRSTRCYCAVVVSQ